ncbi:MAG: 4-hydroxy-tetrahydrodipicolinate synthase [Victivallales bacterium]|nr:4-hydroxy-tetrahydrodipicolinate synthase [Victivallales bacterium]
MKLAGCYTALVTPFKNGVVDYEAFAHLLDAQLAGGVAGVVPVGTTGESPTLTMKEHSEVIEFAIRHCKGKCTVIAGTGANSTAEAIHLTKEAAAMGADATLQVTPYYNKPTDEGLYRHFSEVADKCGLPVVLYNVPGRSGKEIPINVVARLSKNPLIVAVKEAAGSVERVSAIKNVCDITVLSGDDSLTLPMMSVGAKGIISVASNILPAEVQRQAQLALDGDFAGALAIHRKLYPLYKNLFLESNPVPVKAAMADLGMIAEEYRLPLCEMTAANRETLRQTLRQLGLLQ